MKDEMPSSCIQHFLSAGYELETVLGTRYKSKEDITTTQIKRNSKDHL